MLCKKIKVHKTSLVICIGLKEELKGAGKTLSFLTLQLWYC